ncbi:MAG TPA: hypothetical protein VJP80_08315 [Candidatus Saccharimonadales bacterium]|nr:hypothetical protein [Candidatus Saccharimonadales bacterium]
MKKRQTIAVDIDDVLARSAEGFAAFSNQQWGGTMTADQYTEEWAVAWGVDLDEALRRAEEIHELDVFGRYAYFEEAVPVLRGLKKKFNLVAATSRRAIIRSGTDAWLQRHFPDIFRAVHYAGMWDSNKDVAHKLKQTKAELCKEIGADYLIDDQLKHCLAVADAGVTSLLFGDYSWNRQSILPKNVIRVHTWQQVKEYFDAQS